MLSVIQANCVWNIGGLADMDSSNEGGGSEIEGGGNSVALELVILADLVNE
jgi:hypothetical protein